MGPYQTPMALVRDPLMSFFWVILAPVLFLTGAGLIALEFIPDIELGSPEELRAYHTLWLFSAVAMGAWFALMSLWSGHIGAGPFAGRMDATAYWVLIGAMIGPFLLIIPSVLVGSFMSEQGWQYREEVNEAVFRAAELVTGLYLYRSLHGAGRRRSRVSRHCVWRDYLPRPEPNCGGDDF